MVVPDLLKRLILLGTLLTGGGVHVLGMPERLPIRVTFPLAQIDGESYVWQITQTAQGQIIAGGERLAYYQDHQWQFVPSFRKVAIRSLLIDGQTLWISS
jgi:hypothetical protein